MAAHKEFWTSALSGRVAGGPSELLRAEVLDPQFHYESRQLLPHYLAIETVLAREYERMGLLTAEETKAIVDILDSVDDETIVAWRDANMSDIAFALERCVEQRLGTVVPYWHVDRSRNDLQSCAQLMFGLRQLRATAGVLLEFGATAHRLAGETAEMPMPGYTHHQAAQIITPGYYLAAVSDQVLHTARRLLATHDGIDACPLGAGAMAGQQLEWDRDRMARDLGFRRPQPLALTAVASRGWVLEVTAELSIFGAVLSRFCTDLLTWGSSQYGFLDLPDELSGISSAMPQKKNFPVLERIRGRTAHLAAFHLDVLLGQRNTPFTNLVEVSKEAGTHLFAAFETCRSVLRLATAVLAAVTFDAERMGEICRSEFFGGFSLANALTLDEGVPWRRAQVIAGAYVLAALKSGREPSDVDGELLGRVAREHGAELSDPLGALSEAFDVDKSLEQLVSSGSARPGAVRAVLADQQGEYERLRAEWAARVSAGGDPDDE
ncbi:argininosuccinate lyase [Kutzneria sp. 744]|uniref:argininosuccinate lyase n=1 Tax=Kutzneria sp. (strain 744) TaxID=345341 RepID=UPI0003EEC19C|nr:lyase family protein [Kutzneria sp. 744]EWM10354.1 argininosuccinate lyase [Kutzneria sp. 744]